MVKTKEKSRIRKIRVKSASRYEKLAGNVDALTNDMDFDFERNKKNRKNAVNIEVLEDIDEFKLERFNRKAYVIDPELTEKNLGVRREKRKRMIIRTISYPIILINDAFFRIKDRRKKENLKKRAKNAKKS